MLLQTNSYVVPKEKRADHARLMRRFRQIMNRIGANDFEVYEQAGPNWGAGNQAQPTNRFVQIMRFRDRKHQLAVQNAERSDPGAQQIIAEFCELVNFPYQQERGLFVVGFYNSVLPVAPVRSRGGEEEAPPEGTEDAEFDPATAAVAGAAAGAAVGMYAAEESAEEFPRAADARNDLAEASFESETPLTSEESPEPEHLEVEAEASPDDEALAEQPLAASDELLAESTELPAEEDAGEAPLPVNFEPGHALDDELPLSESLQLGEEEPLLSESLQQPGEEPLLSQNEQGGYAGDADLLASEIEFGEGVNAAGEPLRSESGSAQPASDGSEEWPELAAGVEGEVLGELPAEASSDNEVLTPAAEADGEWISEEAGDFEEELPGALLNKPAGETAAEPSAEITFEAPNHAVGGIAGVPTAEVIGEIVGEDEMLSEDELLSDALNPGTGEPSELGELDLSDDDLSHLPLEGEFTSAADPHHPESAEPDFDLDDDLTLDLASRLNADPAAPENGHPTGPGHSEHPHGHPHSNTGHQQ